MESVGVGGWEGWVRMSASPSDNLRGRDLYIDGLPRGWWGWLWAEGGAGGAGVPWVRRSRPWELD